VVITIREELGTMGRSFIASSLILLLLSAVFYTFGETALSNTLGNFTYMCLFLGVILVGIDSKGESETSEDQESDQEDLIIRKGNS
jgi:hypothetical protein